MLDNNGQRGAGGTSGGVMEFLVGVFMMVAGAYLLANQVRVVSRGFRFFLPFGGEVGSFGLSLIPLLIGVAMLFFNGRSLLGWFLTAAGALIIFLGIINNLDIYFQPTSLFNTLVMLVLLAGGFGLFLRGLRPH